MNNRRLNLTPFTNEALSDDPVEPVVKLLHNWPESGDYKIEDNIPVPPKYHTNPLPWMLTMDRLEPGQSFFIQLESTGQLRSLRESYGARVTWLKKHIPGKLFVSRRILENRVLKGMRIWRVE